jgi:hypothetical protein
MKFFRISKDDCQECECPTGIENWLTVTATKGVAPCSANECKISVNLTIPQEHRSCFPLFSAVSYEMEQEGVSEFIQPVNGYPFSSFDQCVISGTVYKIKVKLYRFAGDLNPCIITKDVVCPASEPAGAPCTKDCFEDVWRNQEPITVNINCGGEPCKLFVKYVTRIACNQGYQDIQITSIDKLNTSGTNTNGCALCDDADVFKAAFEEIVRKNAMGFDPKDIGDPCSFTWRAVQATCWARWISVVQTAGPAGGAPIYRFITKYRPCNSECCMRQFKVCRTANGVTIVETNVTNDQYECANAVTPPNYDFYIGGCVNMCNVMENIDGIIGNKTSEEFNQEDYDNLTKNEVILFTHFNDNNKLTLNIENNKLENLEIKIYDLNGIFIKSKLFNKSEINSYINIDISELNSNMYLFEVLTNNNKIFDGKFLKIKE